MFILKLCVLLVGLGDASQVIMKAREAVGALCHDVTLQRRIVICDTYHNATIQPYLVPSRSDPCDVAVSVWGW